MTAKDLKNALLQEAVQGKLVPQIASEGNAKDLLEQIKKERGESLPLATERKRSSATPSAGTPRNAPSEILEDEIPFDIPESWCWCRQNQIATISTGMTPLKAESKFYKDGTIPWVTSSLTSNEYIETVDTYITDYALENTSLTLYPKNTLILAMYGQGKTRGQISELLFPATINQACAAIVLDSEDEYFRKYIKLFHNWNYENVRKEASGSAQPNLNLGKVQTTLIPLPPLAEQKRIVEAIEKFVPLIEEYGKKEAVLKELNANIGTLTKKAILQEAVQGKLVPQIPTEGNAKDLLEQIKAEKAKLIKEGKIKKEKPLPEIMEEEIPFDIPENWCWCRLGELVKISTGNKDANQGSENGEYEFYTCSMTPIRANTFSFDGECLILPGNGANVGLVIYHQGKFEAYQRTYVIEKYNDSIYLKYFLYMMNWNWKSYNDDKLFGSAIPYIKLGNLLNYPVPLPPLAEQKRIVAAIEQLLPLCEKLGK